VSKLSEGLPPCIRNVLKSKPANTATVNYNMLVLTLTSYFHATGWEKGAAQVEADDFITTYSHSESYDTPQKRQEHFDRMWEYTQDNPDYSFHCKFVLSLRLAGFDCKDCSMKNSTPSLEQEATTPDDPDGPPEQGKAIPLIEVIPQTLGALLDEPYAESEPIVAGLVNEEEAVVHAGTKKLGKTTLAMNLGVSVANGTDFLGFEVPEPQPVLYIQQEVAPRFFKERLELMVAGLPRGPVRENFYHVSRRGILLADDTLKLVHRWIEKVQPKLVIVDPLYLFNAGDENSAKDMTEFFRPVFGLIEQYKVSVWIVHHHGKPGQSTNQYDPADRSRGSSVIGGATDVNIAMTGVNKKKYKLDGLTSEYATLSFEFRNLPPRKDMVVYRNPESLIYESVEAKLAKKVTWEDVSEYVLEHRPILKKDLIVALKEEFDAGRTTVLNAINIAVNDNHIVSRHLIQHGSPVEYDIPEDQKYVFDGDENDG